MKTSKIIILVLILIASVAGLTYAYYSWTGRTFIKGISECMEVNYVKGRDITSNSLKIVDNPQEGITTTLKVSLNNNCTITRGNGTLYLDIDTTTSSALLSSNALKYQVVVGNTVANTGVLTSSGKNTICSNIEVTDVETPIIVVLWVDGNVLNSSNTASVLSSTFSGKITMRLENSSQG